MDAAISIALDGFVFASYLFIVAAGLTVIFGVMKILNIAHGSFFTWGAYVAAYLIGLAAAGGWPDWVGFLIIFTSAVGVGVVLGLVLERGVLRFMYGRDAVTVLLATFGAFLVLEDGNRLVFGTDLYFAFQPMMLLGSVEIGGIARANYNLTLLALAAAVASVGWYGLNRTRRGRILLAVIHDREMSEAMGIDVGRIYTATFVLGAILGALGGAYVAPTVSVAPGLSIEIIVLSFAVVVIGGMGSIPGAVVGALIVGLARAVAVHHFPETELFVVYAVMAVSLALRPEGLFAPTRARRI